MSPFTFFVYGHFCVAFVRRKQKDRESLRGPFFVCLGFIYFFPSEKDGEDNTEFESRWSCQEELEPSDTGCYITYEFEEDFVVEHVTMCECVTISPGRGCILTFCAPS